MAIRKIHEVGDPCLTKVCRPVTEFNDRRQELLDDMADTLEEAGGVGLAAPQVGSLSRVCCVEDEQGEIIELINPEIIKTEGEQTGLEGCLSVPGKYGIVTRPMVVRVRAQDRYGTELDVEDEELTARCFCHEIEHLDGHLYTEHCKVLTDEELEQYIREQEKELDEEAFLKEAFELHDLCKKYNVPFFINDNVDIAIRCHAEGIHVGQEDMAAAQVRQRVGDEMMIGVSVHSVEEALEAVRHGADCLGVGAAFSTHTKADVDVLPEGMMKAICDAVDIPVVAIGGIHKENLLRLKGTGVNGVALVSAIFGAEDIEAECRELKALAEQL